MVVKKNPPSTWPSASAKIPKEVKNKINEVAARAGISQPEVLEQLIWGYLDHMIDAWERGEPIPPRPWRDLPMPKKPEDPKPTTVETAETSELSDFLEDGRFPESPTDDETPDAPAVHAPEALPVADGGSTPVRRKRRG